MKLVQLTIGFNVNGEARHNMRAVCEKVGDILNVLPGMGFDRIVCVGVFSNGEAVYELA